MKNSKTFSKEYLVTYRCNPSMPEDLQHFKGRKYEMSEVKTKKFVDNSKAIDFWFECLDPITTLEELGIECEISNIVNETESLLIDREEFVSEYNLIDEYED